MVNYIYSKGGVYHPWIYQQCLHQHGIQLHLRCANGPDGLHAFRTGFWSANMDCYRLQQQSLYAWQYQSVLLPTRKLSPGVANCNNLLWLSSCSCLRDSTPTPSSRGLSILACQGSQCSGQVECEVPHSQHFLIAIIAGQTLCRKCDQLFSKQRGIWLYA